MPISLMDLPCVVLESFSNTTDHTVVCSADKIGNKNDKFPELTSRQFELECGDCVQDLDTAYKLKLKNEHPRNAFLQYGDIEQVIIKKYFFFVLK